MANTERDSFDKDQLVESITERIDNDTTIMPLFSDEGGESRFNKEMFDGDNLPLLPVSNLVLFPNMTMPLSVSNQRAIHTIRESERRNTYFGVILLHDSADEELTADSMYRYGTVAEVLKTLEMPDGTTNVIIQGRKLFMLNELVATQPEPRGKVELLDEKMPAPRSRRMRAVMSNIREDLLRIASFVNSSLPHEIAFALNNVSDTHYLVNFICTSFPMKLTHRQFLLEETDIFKRAMQLAEFVNTEMQFAQIKNDLLLEAHNQLSEQQRQVFLHSQMEAIQQELGENTRSEIDKLKARAAEKHWPEAVQATFDKELARMQRMHEQSPEYSVQFNYLETLIDLPWGKTTRDNLNLDNAQRVLNRDHFGLDKVKQRILEHLAVLKMRGDMKAPIICLFGPPGVGKTSLGRSVARALRRKYVRVSLGGLHDEAEIRGHRRTYVGAMPGRIVTALLKAGTDNPVFVLDEVDKIGTDFKGDAASALLEVLDPEQNTAFHDNYLDVDYDLSNVLFIATANTLSTIAPPLLDRMEIIDLSGYIVNEKVEIGQRHLLPKQKREHGLKDVSFSVPRRTMQAIVEQYTRESGVRQLDKQLAKVMRRVAWRVAGGEEVPRQLKPEQLVEYLGVPDYDPDRYEGNDYAGVVTGLAWTRVGGEILYVESALCKGRGEKLLLTGNLGDVMKESAMLALQYVRAHADELGIDERIFNNYSVHIHCPEGAIPKDGPSAGITMVTSLVSTFTQRRVRPRIAMTGEITLRGRVIPIGGVKEKILAAKRAGITDIVLCVDNRKDVDEIKPIYLDGLTFHYVRDVRDVLNYALLDEQVPHPIAFDVSSGIQQTK